MGQDIGMRNVGLTRRTLIGGAATMAVGLLSVQVLNDALSAHAAVIPLWPTGSTAVPYISSEYGLRAPINGSRTFHYGVDIPMGRGVPVRAALDGTVVYSGLNGTLGEQVVIATFIGQFLYSHMQINTRIAAGSTVRRGDQV